MENFILILGLMLLGKLLSRVDAFPRDSAKSFNLYVVYVALPALILHKVPQLSFSRQLLIPTLMPWAMLIASALMVLLLARLFRWDRQTTGALMLVAPLGNTSFLGIPMVEAFFGAEQIPYAIFYDQLGSFLALATYGTVVLAAYGSADKLTARALVKRICTFPPFIALALAILTKPCDRPPEIDQMLAAISASLVPVVMVAVGFQLKLRLQPGSLTPLSLGLLIKLIIAPLLALAGCKILALDVMAAKVSIFEAGMPPMITAGALALIAGLAPELTAAMVGLGIIASFATLPLLFQLL
ncbi:MAG: AEC family transporter [Desulfobulbaceae bacterium]|nr:AEC family transporter [Desulfobulbaceae bacterium]